MEFRRISRADDPWIHAKLFLAQTPTHGICLQGSANASLAALLRTDPDGNFEMGNLLRGSRDAFDDVLCGLEIGDVVADAADLNVAYQAPDDEDHLDEAGWQLTGAEWTADTLRVSYRGVLQRPPSFSSSSAGPRSVSKQSTKGHRSFSILPRHVGTAWWSGPRSGAAPRWHALNAVFPCDRESLSATLQASPETDERLSRIGQLDLDDDELELLLQELEATMVLDRHSLWQLAARKRRPARPPMATSSISTIPTSTTRCCADIRSCGNTSCGPVAPGYTEDLGCRSSSTQSPAPSPISSSLHTPATAAAMAAVAAEGDKGLQTEDTESDEDETEPDRRRWSRQARINVLLKNFISRFVSGLASTAFQDLAGPEVLASNYVIFLHLLARLYEREGSTRKPSSRRPLRRSRPCGAATRTPATLLGSMSMT